MIDQCSPKSSVLHRTLCPEPVIPVQYPVESLRNCKSLICRVSAAGFPASACPIEGNPCDRFPIECLTSSNNTLFTIHETCRWEPPVLMLVAISFQELPPSEVFSRTVSPSTNTVVSSIAKNCVRNTRASYLEGSSFGPRRRFLIIKTPPLFVIITCRPACGFIYKVDMDMFKVSLTAMDIQLRPPSSVFIKEPDPAIQPVSELTKSMADKGPDWFRISHWAEPAVSIVRTNNNIKIITVHIYFLPKCLQCL